MTLFMDRHEKLEGVTAEDIAAAHLSDVAVQDKYGVKYITYWFDSDSESAFCLVDAPSKEAAEAVHKEAHGLVASRIIEVDPRRVEDFLGRIEEPHPGEPIANSGLRAILFTDMVDSTSITQQLGDEKSMEVLRAHNSIVRAALEKTGGREIKHTGDGIMACFNSVVGAAQCSVHIQKGFEDYSNDGSFPISVRVGLTAGEPVTENDDLFGASVQLAARICNASDPGDILGSNVVRELSLGKDLVWKDRGATPLKGFDEPVSLHELVWRAN
ncbi:MAG: nickel-binding protein [Actinomycetota bacterium]